MIDAEAEEREPATGDLLSRLGQDLDWEEIVRAYPIPAVLVAALGGFVIGRTKGDWVLGAVSAFAAAQISRHLNELLGDEVL